MTEKSLKGTETEKNLSMAYLGETQATKNYLEFAKKAEKEEHIQIKNIFEETSANEKEHAKLFLKFLQKYSKSEKIPLVLEWESPKWGKTKDNLKAAVNGEADETKLVYPKFAEIAKKEGFQDVCDMFLMISKIENMHCKRFQKLLTLLEQGKLYKRDKVVMWKCLNCGNIHIGLEAPTECEVCGHPQGYFEVVSDKDIE
eukprot:EC824846.1.p1 GENE.EC824846.1~~EC824846.1.p1  ORF type:complete len:200 (+),score=71.89 EC824846.1:33-632(+)